MAKDPRLGVKRAIWASTGRWIEKFPYEKDPVDKVPPKPAVDEITDEDRRIAKEIKDRVFARRNQNVS